MLSKKPIPPNERLIFALDVPDVDKAQHLVEVLGDTIRFYKVGLELFLADGSAELFDWLANRDKKIFLDLKFFDVPRTVGSAVRQLRGKNIEFVTVHGNEAILQAACQVGGTAKILAVTVLTSLSDLDLKDFGFKVDVSALVLSRARRALEAGCAGVIASGLEARELRNELGEDFLIVVPGIRPAGNIDDQKRTVDLEKAFENGADYVVVGRPIREAQDPAAAAAAIQDRIAALFNA